MDPEIRRMLSELHDKVDENNKILRSMRRTSYVSAVFSFIKWAVIIGLTIGSYYYFQPYLNQIINTYETLQGSANQIKATTDKFPNIGDIANLLKKL